MGNIVWFVSGKDVREKSKGHNNSDEQELFEEEEDDGQEERDTKDRGVELASALFVGPGRGAPLC